MKFICDTMLGKLAKYLRIVGVDTSYSNFSSWSLIISSAAAEQRTILTRRTNLLLSGQQAACYVIQGNYPYEQLQDVIRHFSLQVDSSRFFTRCLLCNQLLVAVDKASVAGSIPAYVFSTVNDFVRCPQCAKIYWKGTHYGNMLKRLEKYCER
jgi:hypothetical protein